LVLSIQIFRQGLVSITVADVRTTVGVQALDFIGTAHFFTGQNVSRFKPGQNSDEPTGASLIKFKLSLLGKMAINGCFSEI